jgi:hypothetical protein
MEIGGKVLVMAGIGLMPAENQNKGTAQIMYPGVRMSYGRVQSMAAEAAECYCRETD